MVHRHLQLAPNSFTFTKTLPHGGQLELAPLRVDNISTDHLILLFAGYVTAIKRIYTYGHQSYSGVT